jgi:hypothetical protein
VRTVNDLFRIHRFARDAEASFQWVTIPEGVEMERNEIFDPATMGKLYEVGYREAIAGPVWATDPPGFVFETAP